MKILIITPGYLAVPAINGGSVENLIDTIISENENERKLQIDVIAVNDGQNIDTSKFTNTKFYFIDNKKKKFKIKRAILSIINRVPNIYVGNSYIREVKKIIKKTDTSIYDNVVIENNPLYGLVIKKFFKCPLILHLHNDYLNSKTKLCQKVYDIYGKIITVSDYISNCVKTITNKQNEKIITLYNGIDTKKFKESISSEEKLSIRKKYNLLNNDFVFLYTGRIMPEKGVLEMVKGFNLASEENPKIKLLIVGSSSFKSDGKKSKYIQKVLEEVKKNNPNIKFTGYIDYETINKIYHSCDAQIVPSIWNEPLGVTVIEGMATGLPLIVNNVGGIPEMVGNDGALVLDKNNIIESLKNNIIKISEEEMLRVRIVNASKKKLEKFEREYFYNNYVKIIMNSNDMEEKE